MNKLTYLTLITSLILAALLPILLSSCAGGETATSGTETIAPTCTYDELRITIPPPKTTPPIETEPPCPHDCDCPECFGCPCFHGGLWHSPDTPTTRAELDQMLSRWGNNIAVHFECLTSGYIFQHNQNRQFFGASLGKATFALMIYQKADDGIFELDTEIRFRSRHFRGGGTMTFDQVSEYFTLRSLVGYMLYFSDNAATYMLQEYIGGGSSSRGIQMHRLFIQSIGGNHRNFFSEKVTSSMLSANEVAIFMRAINDYIESDAPNSAEFKRNLTQNRFNFLFPNSEITVASKTGWTARTANRVFQGVWHDMTIVYIADRPFILIVMAGGRRGTVRGSSQDREDFQYIAQTFVSFHLTRVWEQLAAEECVLC